MKDTFTLLHRSFLVPPMLIALSIVVAVVAIRHEGVCDRGESIVDLHGKIAVTEMRTESGREKGLSGHPPLASDEGMLFVFGEPTKTSFWMKDMLFPIDIVWLDRNLTVLGYVLDLKPETYPSVFTSPPEMEYTLEISAREVARRGIRPGDQATLTPCPRR